MSNLFQELNEISSKSNKKELLDKLINEAYCETIRKCKKSAEVGNKYIYIIVSYDGKYNVYKHLDKKVVKGVIQKLKSEGLIARRTFPLSLYDICISWDISSTFKMLLNFIHIVSNRY